MPATGSPLPDIAAIRQGIADNISAAITGFQVSAYVLANPTPPCIYVMPGETEYDIAMGNGADRLNFIIRIMVPANGDIAQQRMLDLMCASTGAQSVKAAVEADDSLGGSVADCQVNSCSAPTLYVPDNGPPMFGADLALEVIT